MFSKKQDPLQDFYLNSLKTIHNINFTRREIDIIAFFASGRSAKKVAAFFGISPKTVENHTHNIMLKLQCNSREGILDFIEKSGKLSCLREFYSVSRGQIVFHKFLKQLSVSLSGKNFSCILIHGKDNFSFIHTLEATLKLAGIEILLQTPPLLPGAVSLEKFLLYIPSQELDSFLPSKISFDSLCPESIFLIHPKGNVPFNLFKGLKISSISDLKDRRTYISFILEILRNIAPFLENSFSAFETEYAIIEKEVSPSVVQDKNKYLSKSPPFKDRKFLISPSYFLKIFLGASFLVLGLVSLKNPSDIREIFNIFSYFQVSKSQNIPINFRPLNEDLFLNRPLLGERLHNSFKKSKGLHIVALVGIGGTGKTTMARHYAYSQGCPLTWEINAETSQTLQESFENLAEALLDNDEDQKLLKSILQIKSDEDRTEQILHFIRKHLQSFSKWFLIYDNVTNFSDIQRFLPKDSRAWGKGNIILTTRNAALGNNPCIHCSLPVGELSGDEKRHLFTRIMGNDRTASMPPLEAQDLQDFLEEIPSFPLDISVAAYYLKATHISYKDYLESMSKYNKEFSNVQEKILQDTGDYTQTRYGIITLSLEHLMNLNKDFKDLLLFISLLDSQNIPRELLIQYKSPPVIDSFIYYLKQHSLMNFSQIDTENSSFSLHRSTQAILLSYATKTLHLSQNQNLIESMGYVLSTMMHNVIDKEDFEKMKNLYRHAEQFLSHNLEQENSFTNDYIRGELGCFYYYLCNASKAKHFLIESLEALGKKGKEQDILEAHFLTYLGNVYRDEGNFEKAKELFKESLSIYKNKDERHIGVARASGYLGVTYRALGKLQKAEALLKRSLSIYQKHPENSIGLAWALAHLGGIYRDLGDLQKAKESLEQSLSLYRKHSETYVGAAWVCGDLGSVYLQLGDFGKAKALLEESLRICKQHFYADHIHIAKALMYLGVYYREQKMLKKAKEFLKESLIIYEKAYTSSHIKMVPIFRNLGFTYLLEEDLERAEKFMIKSLMLISENFHPDKSLILENLADLFFKKSLLSEKKGKHSEALTFKKQALFYMEKTHQSLENNPSQQNRLVLKFKEYKKALLQN